MRIPILRPGALMLHNPTESTKPINGEPVQLEAATVYPIGFHEDNLKDYVTHLNKEFTNTGGKHKTELEARNAVGNLWKGIGYSKNSSSEKFVKDTPWSAATVSNLVMAANNAYGDNIKNLGFNPSASHSSFIRDAFKTVDDENYKYNMYKPTKIKDAEFEIGDIVFRGREETKNWNFDDFKDQKDSYPSHSDVIVDKGTDKKGDFVVIAGGNRTNQDLGLFKRKQEGTQTFSTSKLYVKDLDKKYVGGLKRSKA